MKRYRADIGGDKTVWPIVVPDPKGYLVYYTDAQKRIKELEDLVDKLLWINGVKIYRN